jgi:hypothetical protein
MRNISIGKSVLNLATVAIPAAFAWIVKAPSAFWQAKGIRVLADMV